MEKKPDIRIFIACHKPTYVPENSLFYPVQVYDRNGNFL